MVLALFVILFVIIGGSVMAADSGLVGHWKLGGDCKDYSGRGNHGQNHGADLTAKGPDGKANGAAEFDGRDACIEVADRKSLHLGVGDFSISVWVDTDKDLDDVLGDIVSKYDPVSRKGFNFSIENYAGVVSAQSNYRNVHFGIDCGRIDPAWTDCGQPGNGLLVHALTVHEGSLYAGTFEAGGDEAGHVYRYEGGTEWIDCGSPDRCNAVMSLAVYDGRLYAGVSHYRARGSSLPDSPNQHPGGRVYRYEGGKGWIDCGKLGSPGSVVATADYDDYVKRLPGWTADDVDTVCGMVVYGGKLYAMSAYHQGVFRYDGGKAWTDCGSPGCRLMALGVFNGGLYAAGNQGNKLGGVYRYDGGRSWTRTGDQAGVDQVYSFAIYEGKMYVGTWPEGTVFRYDGGETWTNCGRLGSELEVMGMAVYNGKLYAGTLPLAEVYRYDREGGRRHLNDSQDRSPPPNPGESSGGGTIWTRTGQLDATPDVRYRRACSMAVFQGRLFCGTLPSGHVYSLEAGKGVTYDYELGSGWRHLVAVRGGDRLRLYVDGRLVATSSIFNPTDYDISNDRPLKIGFGAHDHFNGRLRDLRIYNRALMDSEVTALYGRP